MDDRHALGLDYGHYPYALALHGQPSLDDMDVGDWKLFGQQDSSNMSLHHHLVHGHQGSVAPRAHPAANFWPGFDGFSGNILSMPAPPLPPPPPPPAPSNDDDADDDADDAASTCDSDCSGSEICHDSTCSDDPAACCEDETCLLKEDDVAAPPPPPAGKAITSEDAIAAAALASFVAQPGQQQQQQQQQQLQQSQQLQLQQLQHQLQHQHQQQHVVPPPAPCMQLGLWPDLCISPQFLTNYQHLREAHNPLQPTACDAPRCPVEDPSFYQECHIRHVAADAPTGLFDHIDLDLLMNNHEHYHEGGVECGAKFSSGEDLIQHVWHEHRAANAANAAYAAAAAAAADAAQKHQHQPWPMEPPPGFVSSVSSVSPSVVSLPSHKDLTRSPEPCAEVPVAPSVGSLTSAASAASAAPEKPLRSECLWCDDAGQPCGQVFDAPGDLHQHVLAAHTQALGRDSGGTYSCGWHGCTRRAGNEKGGFAQKSKIERHMQVHTGNKPFTCDICCQSFSANQALLQHKLIHQDSKPLACEICGKTFRQHSALTMHIRTHTKVRPLKCPHCHKEFSESSNLSKHKRIHAGEGQYECAHPGCKRTFHRKDQLRRHSALHTRAPAAPAAAVASGGQ